MSELSTQVQGTIHVLEHAEQAPTNSLKQATHEALTAAIQLRDTLIQQLRAVTGPEERVTPRSALDQVNVAISLITGVEYPVEKMDRQALKSARGLLQGMVASGWV